MARLTTALLVSLVLSDVLCVYSLSPSENRIRSLRKRGEKKVTGAAAGIGSTAAATAAAAAGPAEVLPPAWERWLPFETRPLEGEFASTYWFDPRIHSFGNVGLGGGFHAFVAPCFTFMLDLFAYSGTNLRTTVVTEESKSRAQAGLSTQRILDLGCGTGFSSRALAAEFPTATVVALDTSDEMLQMARTLSPGAKNIEYKLGNAENTGLPAATFDCVSLMFLLHEAPQGGRRKILREAKRLLAPGGSLIISDIAREYSPSPFMRSGEPYIDGYLENIESDIRATGFTRIGLSQPIPGRAETWTCKG